MDFTGKSKTKMGLETVKDILESRAIAGDRVVVLGGGMSGLMVIDFLLKKEKKLWP